MPHAVRTDKALRELAEALARAEGPGEAYAMLYALLTPREREEIALRWMLVCLLARGLTQRAIAGELGVSLCKITRGSHELKYGPKEFSNAVRRVVGRRKAARSGRRR